MYGNDDSSKSDQTIRFAAIKCDKRLAGRFVDPATNSNSVVEIAHLLQFHNIAVD